MPHPPYPSFDGGIWQAVCITFCCFNAHTVHVLFLPIFFSQNVFCTCDELVDLYTHQQSYNYIYTLHDLYRGIYNIIIVCFSHDSLRLLGLCSTTEVKTSSTSALHSLTSFQPLVFIINYRHTGRCLL